jgi:hypothetical protein
MKRRAVKVYKPDPLKTGNNVYYIAPNNGEEIKAMFQGTQGIHLLTEHHVTYMLFPLLENDKIQALKILSLVIDLIVQEFPCGSHMDDKYKKEALWATMPRFIILALVKVDTQHSGYEKGSFLSEKFFDPDVPVCPIAFLLCKNRTSDNGVQVVYSHLEIVCAQPAPPVNKEVGLTFSTGHILLYYMLDYALNTLKQDVELNAMDDSPMLIRYYASHGFILCDQYGGCRQLTAQVIAKFDSVMKPFFDPAINWNEGTREKVRTQLGLSKQQAIVMADNGTDKVGWYMLFCSTQRTRLEMSKRKHDELLAKHDNDGINLASRQVFKGKIKFAKRDGIFEEFKIKHNTKL